MKSYLVDTDVLIDYTKGHDRLLEGLLKQQQRGSTALFVSPVTIAEFFTDRSLRNEMLKEQAVEFLNLFGVKEVTKRLGLLAGDFLRESRVQTLGDAIIAATAVVERFILVTRNSRHYRTVADLEVYNRSAP